MFLRLKPFLTILMLSSSSAFGLVQSSPTPLPAPAPVSNPAQQNNPPPASVVQQRQNLEAVVSNQSAPLTAEQARELAKTTNLSPQQMQSIANALQQAQINQSLPTNMTTPSTTAALPEEEEEDFESDKRTEAFNALMEEILPLSPDQIEKLHKFHDLTEQAKAATPSAPPNPNFTSIAVKLDPGSLPPVIRLAAGFVTSILFVDSTGAPWPITAYSIGDPQSFNIQWDQKGNTLFIQSMKQYAHGNLAVRLWSLDTPVMLTLVSGQKNVDFRVDLQVAGRGPDAKPATVETIQGANVNPLLINILDGIPPRDSIKLSVSGGHGEAWLVDNRIYFRTKLTVLSPAWTSKVASTDGTIVYEMMLTPAILASENGRTVDIKLSGL